MIVINAFRAHTRRTCFTKVIDDFVDVFWARYRLKTSLNQRHSVFSLKEADDLHVAPAFFSRLLYDVSLAGWTPRKNLVLSRFNFLRRHLFSAFDFFMQSHFDDLNKALSTMSAAALMKDKGRPKLHRLLTFFLPLSIFFFKLL